MLESKFTLILESAIIAELDLGVHSCGQNLL